MTNLRAGAATDVGRVRQINEDRFLADEAVYAVADGVGGHQAGEVAAQTSIDVLRKSFTDHTTAGLRQAVERANRAVWELAQANAEKRGMGTTLTAVALVVDNGEEQLAVVNVGDSRAYLLQQGELLQVSQDHSLVEEMVREGQISAAEAAVHPQRSIITRALGMEPAVEVDSWTLVPYRGDRVLLCSDGLTNELSNDRIAAVLRRLSDPEEAARDLVRQARDEGGGDNITAVVVDVVDDDDRSRTASAAVGTTAADTRAAETTTTGAAPASPVSTPTSKPVQATTSGPGPDLWRPSGVGAGVGAGMGTGTGAAARRSSTSGAGHYPAPPRRGGTVTWRSALFLALVLAVLGTGAGAVTWYARSAYYVGIDGDRVAVYRGRPGGLLWFQPTLYERKRLTVDQLLPLSRSRLQEGHSVATKAEADRYVNNLEQAAQARATTTTTTPTTTTPVDSGVPAPPSAPTTIR
ncbi:MAG: Stp1/IreP family PP2C-type Ser/Thr phosphatase [Acidimicrobiales bacterium]